MAVDRGKQHPREALEAVEGGMAEFECRGEAAVRGPCPFAHCMPSVGSIFDMNSNSYEIVINGIASTSAT